MLPLFAALAFTGCGDDGNSEPTPIEHTVDLTKPVKVDVSGYEPASLAEYNLFTWSEEEGFTFHEDVVGYDLNTPLFTDYALKSRAIYIPEGKSMEYKDDAAFEFPVGSLILKTFYYPADLRKPDENIQLLETRILIRLEDGWTARPYVWNEDQTDAYLHKIGRVVPHSFIGHDGEELTANYTIPQKNQCQQCHSLKPEDGDTVLFLPIGPKARHLNRIYDYGHEGELNQLEHFQARGILSGMPAIEDVPKAYDFAPIEELGLAAVEEGDIEKAARDYLDINCAHCHSPTGVQGISSQLFLNHDNEDQHRLGICKKPGSAGNASGGNDYDIVPGDPEASILHFRINTEEAGKMMPVIARSLRHTEGVELVHAWIQAMPPNDTCPPTSTP